MCHHGSLGAASRKTGARTGGSGLASFLQQLDQAAKSGTEGVSVPQRSGEHSQKPHSYASWSQRFSGAFARTWTRLSPSRSKTRVTANCQISSFYTAHQMQVGLEITICVAFVVKHVARRDMTAAVMATVGSGAAAEQNDVKPFRVRLLDGLNGFSNAFRSMPCVVFVSCTVEQHSLRAACSRRIFETCMCCAVWPNRPSTDKGVSCNKITFVKGAQLSQL